MSTSKRPVTPEAGTTRREIIRKAAYAVPAILTLTAAPAFAQSGSGSGGGSTTKKKKK